MSVRSRAPIAASGAMRLPVLAVVFLTLTAAAASAQPGADGGPFSDAGPPTDAAPPPEPDSPAAEALRQRARQIDALVDGSLALEVAPLSLFDVPLADEAAVRVEIERLRSVLGQEAETLPEGDAGPPADGGPAALGDVPEDLYRAHLALDRARLAFYELPAERREQLLQEHSEKQGSDLGAKAELDDAARRGDEAEALRQQALEDARRARSEAARRIAEERARLHGVSRAQAEYEADLVGLSETLKERANTTLAFQRRVGEVDSHAEADELYDQLRAFLRASRAELADAIEERSEASSVPQAGPSALRGLPADIDLSAVSIARIRVLVTGLRLELQEGLYRRTRVSQIYDEVLALNAARLELLDALSSDKKNDITGFSPAGVKQAGSELLQVTLVIRYHAMTARDFATGSGESHGASAFSAITAGIVLIQWFIAAAVFLWWRKRGGVFLRSWRARIAEEDRRGHFAEPSRLYRLLGVILEIRKPLEWFVLVVVLAWLLPAKIAATLELRLLSTILFWTIGGSLVVSSINALADTRSGGYGMRASIQVAGLRLRSLRLVGRTIVTFGLILSLTNELVGRGTIYSWVFSVCWFAAIPIVLLLVRWWRAIIFKRVEAVRKKNYFERWVVAHQEGWRSFPAAVAAGAYLLATGAVRSTRSWLGGFDLTRRGLAYLFRRGLDRLAEERSNVRFEHIPRPTYDALGPLTPSNAIIRGRFEAEVQRVIERVNRPGGGVFAVVGERGSGKTTVLEQVGEVRKNVYLVDCPPTGLDDLCRDLATAIGHPPDTELEDCAAWLDEQSRDSGFLIDDAQRLIRPVMGGLSDFDTMVQMAREHSVHCSWFFAVDTSIWRFFERARGARPLFDDVLVLEPWREEDIAELLRSRSAQVGIEPSFELLLGALPANADEQDRAEARERAAAGYYRLLWDYSAGNPGVALHMWRRSLGLDEKQNLCVKLFQAPDSKDLELLPDSAVFVLRAVVQLEPARAEDVASATMLRLSQVADALRYGLAHGYLERVGDRYRVTWGWFRALTRFLQRRHLLVAKR